MRITTRLTLAILTCVTIFTTPLLGATTLLEEIDVRGERQSPISEALTIREVRESPARDMGEALQTIPGFDSVRKGAIANDINLRGLQKDNINVFLDGVRLHGGCPSRMDPPSFHFDFAEVEEIEIIKGPYDLENPGSLGGMVNAKSKQPPLGKNAKFSLTYGSDELMNLSGTASMATEKSALLGGYAYKSSLSPETGDDTRQIEAIPAPMVGAPIMMDHRYRPNLIDSEAYKIHTAWLKGSYNLSSNLSNELSYSYQNAEDVYYPYLFMDAEYDRTHRLDWKLKADQLDTLADTFELQLYWNKVDHLMNDVFRISSSMASANPATPDYSMETDSSTSVYGAKAKADWELDGATLSGGIDYYYRNWDAVNVSAAYNSYQPQAMLPDVDVNNIGAFVGINKPLSDTLSLKGGARVDLATTEANALSQARLMTLYETNTSGAGLSSENDFTNLSGNLQLSWQATPTVELFSGLGLGSRTPDPQELYIGLDRGMMASSWVGNPNLDATLNRQFDLGAKLSGDSYFLNFSFFYSDLVDYINLTNDVKLSNGQTVKTYQNVAATLWGGELNSQLALPFDLYLRGTLAYVRGENDDSNQPLAEIPPLNGSVALRWDNDVYFVELTERFADRQDRVDPDLNEEETSGWGVTDIKAGANWENWTLTGGVNNLFDRYYTTHLSYQRDPFSNGVRIPEAGAMLYATLSYSF